MTIEKFEPTTKPLVDDLSCLPDAETAQEIEESEEEDLLVEFGLVSPTLTVTGETIRCRKRGRKTWVNINVEWTNLEGFEYELKIVEVDSTFEDSPLHKAPGPHFTFRRLDFDTTYKLYIRALYGELKGDWSDPPLEYTTIAEGVIPAPVNVSLDFEDREKTKGNKWTGVVSWDEVTLGSCDPTDVDEYLVELWRWDPITSSFIGTTPVRKKRVAAHDEDPGNRCKARFYPIPKKYWYKARVKTIVNHDRSPNWSSYSGAGSPLDEDGPDTPLNVKIVGSANGVLTTWNIPSEWVPASGTVSTSGTSMSGSDTWFLMELSPGDQVRVGNEIRIIDTITDDESATVTQAFNTSFSNVPYSYDGTVDDYDHCRIQMSKNKNFNNIVEKDFWVHSEKKEFKVNDSDLYYTRVCLVDTSGMKSKYINATLDGNSSPSVEAQGASKEAGNLPNPPSTPGNLTGSNVSFDSNGTRHSRFRMIVDITGKTVANADWYVVQFAHSSDSGSTPPAGTKRHWQRIDGDGSGDDLTATFKHIPKNHYCWVRHRAANAGGKSAFSNWYSAGQPSATGKTLANATSITKTKPKPGRIVWAWDYPEDDLTTHWHCIVKYQKDSTWYNTEEGVVRQPRFVYDVPRSERGMPHKITIKARGDNSADTESGSVDDPSPETPTTSDGVVPASSPNSPTVKPGILQFTVRWTPVENTDRVTYKVYVQSGTDTGFTCNDSSNLVGSTTDCKFVVTKLYGDAALVAGTNYCFRIIATDADGAAAAGTGTGPVQCEKELPDAPGTPNNLSGSHCSFDGKGTRHARYRLVVDNYPTSGSGGPAAWYSFRMAHTDSSGSSPPSGTKRHYQRVDADATGDDASAIFKNIPRNHYVWVQHRAGNAGGSSSWTTWYSAGRPMDSAASHSPASLTNTSTISSTRRAGAKWDLPLIGGVPDDSVAFVHVQVSRNAGFSDIVDEAYKNPGKGSHRYAIPKNDQGTRHYVRMRPISDTGTAGSWQPSTTGYEVIPEQESGAQTTATPAEGSVADIDMFSEGLRPIRIVASLPPLPNAEYTLGDLVLWAGPPKGTGDWKLYRLTYSGWTAAVDGEDIMKGTIGAEQIIAGSITGDRIQAGTIEAGRLASTLVMGQYMVLTSGGEFRTGTSGNCIVLSNSGKDRITFYSGTDSAALQASSKNIVLTDGKFIFGNSELRTGGNPGTIYLNNVTSAPGAPSNGVILYAREGKLRYKGPNTGEVNL